MLSKKKTAIRASSDDGDAENKTLATRDEQFEALKSKLEGLGLR